MPSRIAEIRAAARAAVAPTMLGVAMLFGGRLSSLHAATEITTATAVSDSSEVVAAVAKFHAALASGDSSGALALLASDAVVLESGGVETRADYGAHHLKADIDFARAVPSTRTVTRVTVQGDAAWVVSTSLTQGEMNGRAINSVGAELTVLRRTPAGWRISAIHWSSRNRRAS
jgi:ketosteroid isomerase-like protein